MDLIAVAGKAGIVRRTNLDSLKAHAERVHLPWHVARTVAVMAEVPILKVNRMMFLDAAGAEAFDRAVARFRHLDAAISTPPSRASPPTDPDTPDRSPPCPRR